MECFTLTIFLHRCRESVVNMWIDESRFGYKFFVSYMYIFMYWYTLIAFYKDISDARSCKSLLMTHKQVHLSLICQSENAIFVFISLIINGVKNVVICAHIHFSHLWPWSQELNCLLSRPPGSGKHDTDTGNGSYHLWFSLTKMRKRDFCNKI